MGGFDPLSKGSWLAINTKTKNLAFVTNYDDCQFMEITDPKLRRGTIVRNFATLEESVEDKEVLSHCFDHFLANKEKINGVNIVYLNAVSGLAQYASNFYDGPMPVELEQGKVYGITNNSLSQPEWPKQANGKTHFTKILEQILSKNSDPESICNILLTYMSNGVVYNVEGNDEDSNSSLFVRPDYYVDPRWNSHVTMSSTAIIVTESESGE